ncbi:target of Sbf [Exophiala xenobiotica]|nr:target of Sbf [Exophiala xenobiotica]KAK5324259.1 target of Sbf [Exophiala xenobiotica]KAK5410941.1 target of Sbf [Exophiala xenobiotica]KAK5442091.1 target of Sbf [Exophiala xenobiotica]
MKIRHAAWVIPSTLLAAAGTAVAQDSSSSTCTLEGGNYYCSQIDAISYSKFGTAGQYQRVTNMDSQGQCDFSPTSYGGGMAPFDDEVSWHFRGPIQLKQFAYYTLGSSSQSTTTKSKRDSYHPSPHLGRYAHQHFHQSKRDAQDRELAAATNNKEKRADGDDWTAWFKVSSESEQETAASPASTIATVATVVIESDSPETTTTAAPADPVVMVTATIDGKIVSWTNDYFGPSATSTFATLVSSAQSDSASVSASAVATSATIPFPVTASSSADDGYSAPTEASTSASVSASASSEQTSSYPVVSLSSSSTSAASSSTTSSSAMASSTELSSAVPSSSASSTAAMSSSAVSSEVPSSTASSTAAMSSSAVSSEVPSSTASSTAALSSSAVSSEVPSSTASSSAASSSTPSTSSGADAGTWDRQAYYNAEAGSADGLVFLNHFGGGGSGVFDTTWGLSLSYANADNTGASSGPVTLADTLVGDNSEFVIMTDKACSGENGDCGYYRPGSVAYHGFSGASKLFLLEFQMPLTGTTGFNMDMPAAWMLNALVPRTQQYGNCSCWTSGCGEFDIFEVLDSGNTKCKSTWHGAHSIGDSDYFARPTGATIKVAVVLDGSGSTTNIMVLDDATTFDESVTEASVSAWLSGIAAGEKTQTSLPTS